MGREQPRRRDPGHPQHPDVHEDNVGRADVGERHGLDPVRGFAHDLDVEDSGWTQELYEQRTTITVREVLLEPATTASAHNRSS